MSRLHEIGLPENREEALSLIKECIFGSVKTFAPDGFEIIKPKDDVKYHTYAIIDAMYISDISLFLEGYDAEWKCLWKGESEGQFSFYAPYIVRLEEGAGFTHWFFENKWGKEKEWGMFIRSYYSLHDITHHLRKFNQIYDEVNETWVFFRYYSTVAIENIIPALPPDDFTHFFTGINQVISDGSSGKLLII